MIGNYLVRINTMTLLFADLQPIPIKRKPTLKGIPHPEMSRFWMQMTPEQREAHKKKISDGMKKHHAKRTPLQNWQKKIKILKTRIMNFPAGAWISRELSEYYSYLRNFDIGLLSDEEVERRRQLRSDGMKKAWERTSPECKKKRLAKMHGGDIRDALVERDVPRVKTFCGVVREA